MAKIIYVVVEITFKVAVMISSVSKISSFVPKVTFAVAQRIFKEDVPKITYIVAEIIFKVVVVTSFVA